MKKILIFIALAMTLTLMAEDTFASEALEAKKAHSQKLIDARKEYSDELRELLKKYDESEITIGDILAEEYK